LVCHSSQAFAVCFGVRIRYVPIKRFQYPVGPEWELRVEPVDNSGAFPANREQASFAHDGKMSRGLGLSHVQRGSPFADTPLAMDQKQGENPAPGGVGEYAEEVLGITRLGPVR
jgi:hypothetical protein